MIKDKLTEAVQTGLNNIKKGDDHIPLKMRGELEVIVKDRDGNVLSYERDHNQVTKLAKMAIIHLLAGEIGTLDQPILSWEDPEHAGMRALYLSGSSSNPPANSAPIPNKFDPDTSTKHNLSLNGDGQLVSGMQFFYDGSQVINANKASILSQVNPYEGESLYCFNYPTKMLFGTGIEAHDETSFNEAYSDVVLSGSTINLATAARINGYSSSEASSLDITSFFKNLNTTNFDSELSANMILSNWYSADPYRCRTLQPATTEPLSATPTSDDTAIKGAIKNCYITDASQDLSKYNSATKMAYPQFRGYGYPCFIYATRKTDKFYDTKGDNTNVYYQKNDIFDTEPYETELTYTVIMPSQPVNSNDVTTFYPYNGWILKQAGLFCDSRYMLRSRNNDLDLGEAAFLSKVNSGNVLDSEAAHSYRDSVGGQMLFTRNLSSPIMKTADTEVAFVWHIFITV